MSNLRLVLRAIHPAADGGAGQRGVLKLHGDAAVLGLHRVHLDPVDRVVEHPCTHDMCAVSVPGV